MERTRRYAGILVLVLVIGASGAIFFDAAKVALSQSSEAAEPPAALLTEQAGQTSLKPFFVVYATVTPKGNAVERGSALTWRDLDAVASKHLMTVNGGDTPEALLRAILGNRKLPPYVREPFVELAKAKAPCLLSEVGGVGADMGVGEAP